MSRSGKAIKDKWKNLPASQFVPMTFGQLKVGDKFIALPCPGDNSGHGGFKSTAYLFRKVRRKRGESGNAVRLVDGVLCTETDFMSVIKVQ